MATPVSMQPVLGAVLLYLVAGALVSIPYNRRAKG
jgi:hypothetical protein